jgi:hypothetical protein
MAACMSKLKKFLRSIGPGLCIDTSHRIQIRKHGSHNHQCRTYAHSDLFHYGDNCQRVQCIPGMDPDLFPGSQGLHPAISAIVIIAILYYQSFSNFELKL